MQSVPVPSASPRRCLNHSSLDPPHQSHRHRRTAILWAAIMRDDSGVLVEQYSSSLLSSFSSSFSPKTPRLRLGIEEEIENGTDFDDHDDDEDQEEETEIRNLIQTVRSRKPVVSESSDPNHHHHANANANANAEAAIPIPLLGWDSVNSPNYKGLLFPLYEKPSSSSSSSSSTTLRVWTFACIYNPIVLTKRRAQAFLEKIVLISEYFRETPAWNMNTTALSQSHASSSSSAKEELPQQLLLLLPQNEFGPVLQQRMDEMADPQQVAVMDETLDLTQQLMKLNRVLLNATRLEQGQPPQSQSLNDDNNKCHSQSQQRMMMENGNDHNRTSSIRSSATEALSNAHTLPCINHSTLTSTPTSTSNPTLHSNLPTRPPLKSLGFVAKSVKQQLQKQQQRSIQQSSSSSAAHESNRSSSSSSMILHNPHQASEDRVHVNGSDEDNDVMNDSSSHLPSSSSSTTDTTPSSTSTDLDTNMMGMMMMMDNDDDMDDFFADLERQACLPSVSLSASL